MVGRRDREAGADVDAQMPLDAGLRAVGDEHAQRDPECGPDDADDGGLAEDRAQDLAAGGSERSQESQLAGSLADEHREGVDDDERADEQSDAGEDQQERGEEAEALLDGVLVVGLDLVAGHGLGGGGSTSAMASRSVDWVTPCSAVTVIEGTVPSGAKS